MRSATAAKALLLSFVLGGSIGCKSRKNDDATATAPSSSAPVRLPEPTRRRWPLPSGPMLAVLAGQGVGPIRIGATVATIERHMALPCEIKTAEVCRYLERGVEFQLENGVTKAIYVQRAGRRAPDGAEFGFFNGAIPPDLQLGMIPKAIEEQLGPAKRVEKSGTGGAALRVETHHYDGMTIEYDRIENGNLVMSGILITKPAPAEGSTQPAGNTPVR
jgi:hypothetical protein